MDPGQIIWLFFMFSALQPVIKQKLLEASRKRLIALIERERKSRVVLLVHRQETMSLLGFPLFRYIDINDSEDVIRAVHLTDPEIPLDLVLHTPGGLVLAATQIARAAFKKEVEKISKPLTSKEWDLGKETLKHEKEKIASKPSPIPIFVILLNLFSLSLLILLFSSHPRPNITGSVTSSNSLFYPAIASFLLAVFVLFFFRKSRK